jgi:hypothetical protein
MTDTFFMYNEDSLDHYEQPNNMSNDWFDECR